VGCDILYDGRGKIFPILGPTPVWTGSLRQIGQLGAGDAGIETYGTPPLSRLFSPGRNGFKPSCAGPDIIYRRIDNWDRGTVLILLYSDFRPMSPVLIDDIESDSLCWR